MKLFFRKGVAFCAFDTMKQIHGGDIYRNEVLYDFSVNTNPYGPPKGVVEALKEGLMQMSLYPDVNCEQLTNRIAQKENLDPAQILCTNGAAEFFFAFVQALAPKHALICTPSFAEYEKALESVDCQIKHYELKEEKNFYLQENFLDALSNDLDVVFLCSPNNPTGSCIPNALLEKIILTCEKNKIHLLLDLCFMDFFQEDMARYWIQFMKQTSYLHCVKAFTKLYAIPGIRLGYGMSCNQKLLEKIKKMLQPWNVSSFAQLAGVQALKETEYVKESLSKLKQQKEWMYAQFSKYGIDFFESQANYILFRGPKDLYEKMLEHKILIRDCSNYSGLKKGYYRIAVKTKEENEVLIQALCACIKT